MPEKLTEAQMRALRLVAKRDWPAGEPRLGWLHVGTAHRLLNKGLIAERPNTAELRSLGRCSPIVDLTPTGRLALNPSKEASDGPVA